MNENKQLINTDDIKDLTYRLVEMTESMKQAINNANSVKKEQLNLAEILEKYASEEYAEFITKCKEYANSLEEQISILEKRISLLEKVVNNCSKEEYAEHTSILLTALGVFEQN